MSKYLGQIQEDGSIEWPEVSICDRPFTVPPPVVHHLSDGLIAVGEVNWPAGFDVEKKLHELDPKRDPSWTPTEPERVTFGAPVTQTVAPPVVSAKKTTAPILPPTEG